MGEILKILNKKKYDLKITNKKIAKISGIHVNTVQRILAGENIPELKTLVKLTNALGYKLTIKLKKT